MIAWLLVACAAEEAVPERPEGLLLVADSGNGRVLFADHAADERVGELCLGELFADRCAREADGSWVCLVFGVTPDADELRVVHAWSDTETQGFPGGVMGLLPGHPPTVTWSVDLLSYPDDPDLDAICADSATTDLRCRLNMPHMAEWMPDGETLVVADTLNNRVAWLRPGEGDRTPVLQTLGRTSPAVENAWWPNAVQVVESGDTTYLLVTFKGSDPTVTGAENLGRIQLWDITDLDAMDRVWAWPEDGYLAAVHGGRLDEGYLLYAHAFGASDNSDEGILGSVGVARLELPQPPEYLADVLIADVKLGFVRHVEFFGDDELLVTDSGCENDTSDCRLPGRISEVKWTEPAPTGASGAWSPDHAEQVFVELDEERQGYIGGLAYPFESRLLQASAAPDPWWDLGGCP